MKTKTFSNARSFSKLMLCNRNLKVSIYNFVKFRLQSLSSKIKRAFEKITRKMTLIWQLIGPWINVKFLIWKKHIFFCKNELLFSINNLSLVLEIIISWFSYSYKIMSRNTFPKLTPVCLDNNLQISRALNSCFSNLRSTRLLREGVKKNHWICDHDHTRQGGGHCGPIWLTIPKSSMIFFSGALNALIFLD